MYREVARILRPGGLFLSGEWGRFPSFHPQITRPTPTIPGSSRFFEVLSTALARRQIHPVSGRIPQFITGTGQFTAPISQIYYMPIGPWHADPGLQRIGRAFRVVHLRYADAVKPLLVEVGHTHEEVDEIVEEYAHELRTVPGMVSIFHTVHARRL